MSCDPSWTIDGYNLYTFVRTNPLKHVDAVGLVTIVATISGDIIPSDNDWPHASIFIENKGKKSLGEEAIRRGLSEPDGDSVLYDPGGSFGTNGERGSDDLIYSPDLKKYTDYHARGKATVTLNVFDTSAEDEIKLIESASFEGGQVGGWCAVASVNVLTSIDRFSGLQNEFFDMPHDVAENVKNLSDDTAAMLTIQIKEGGVWRAFVGDKLLESGTDGVDLQSIEQLSR